MSITDFIETIDPIQAERLLRVESPLGPDVLLPERFELREGGERPVRADRRRALEDTVIEPADLIGRAVDVSLETGAGTRRTWNGLCSTLQVGPPALIARLPTTSARSCPSPLARPGWTALRYAPVSPRP